MKIMFKLNVLFSNLCLLPLVLSADTTKSLALCFTPSHHVLTHIEPEPFIL